MFFFINQSMNSGIQSIIKLKKYFAHQMSSGCFDGFLIICKPLRIKENIRLSLHVSLQVLFLLQEHAFELSQKYKEGKYIIELAHMIKENGWD